MSLSFPVTLGSFNAVVKKEPIAFQPCRGRTLSLLNAVIYGLRIFVDPICSICQISFHLFKASYFCSHEKSDLKKSKVEAIKAADYLISGVCAPVLNLILAGKCLAGSISPKICYRQATSKELAIIHQFQKFEQKSLLLSNKGITDLKNFNFKTPVHVKMQNLKKASAKVRAAYFQLKVYTV